MNKELLNNPEVKEIANNFARKCFVDYEAKNFNTDLWNDFVASQEKDWEITRVRYRKNTNDCGTSYVVDNGVVLGLSHIPTWEYIITQSCWDIYQVRRNSDKAIFTVNDMVFLSGLTFPIKNLRLSKNGQVYANENILLFGAKKAKEVLFTTFDNKPVYENDVICMLEKHNWHTRPITATEDMIRDCGFYKEKEKLNLEFFSTHDVAQEYIIINRQCLSIQDMLNSGDIISGSPQYNKIVELSKQKQAS